MSLSDYLLGARYLEEPDLSDVTAEDCTALLGEIADELAALRFVQTAVRNRMGAILGEGGYAKLGRFVYRYRRDRRLKVRPEREGDLFDWIEQQPGAARRLFNANYAKVGQLKEVLSDYVDYETGEVGLDALYEWEEGEPTVQEMPVDSPYLPKYIVEQPDGIYPKARRGD